MRFCLGNLWETQNSEIIDKAKLPFSGWSVGRMLISLSKAVIPQMVIPLLSVTWPV